MKIGADGLKTCSSCREVKAADGFHKSRRKPDGLHNQCRECIRIANKSWRERNPERKKATNLKHSRQVVLTAFNLTEIEYAEMLAKQNGVCAICHRVCPTGKSLAVDHDHACCPGNKSCGKCVRGLLCSSCNTALGLFKDDPERLVAAATYLSRVAH